MRRRRVFNYEIFGTAYGWAMGVDISRNERTGVWKVYVKCLEHQYESTETFGATEPEDFVYIAEEKGMCLTEFAHELSDSGDEALSDLGTELL